MALLDSSLLAKSTERIHTNSTSTNNTSKKEAEKEKRLSKSPVQAMILRMKSLDKGDDHRTEHKESNDSRDEPRPEV